MRSCSSISSSSLRSRRSRTRCSRILRRWARLQVTLLFLAVWWVWVFTSWITNWLDPEKTPVRLLLFAMMLGGLVLSTSIPAAFDGARIVVCHRLCGDAGRQDDLSVGLDAAVAAADAHERHPHRRLAFAVGDLLDRGRVGARRVAARALGDRACDRIYFAGGAVLDSPLWRVFRRGLGDRRRPHGRALRAASSSSRSANPSS